MLTRNKNYLLTLSANSNLFKVSSKKRKKEIIEIVFAFVKRIVCQFCMAINNTERRAVSLRKL